MTSTGIAIFAYNRPQHLKRVLNGLQKNDIEHLYVFIDGPKNEQDKKQVESVRTVADNVNWCEKKVITSDHNLGLAESLTTGIERVFRKHDRIIVIEDDCVPSTNFISFMDFCLDKYENEEQVMNINAYSPPITIPDGYPYDIYFTYRSSSWGWGTWRSAWEHFEQDPLTFDELKSNRKEIKQDIKKAGTDLYPMMRHQLKGDIDSWAVWWSYAIASENGVCVNPVNSKIKNIGHDNTGTHTGESDKYDVKLDDEPTSKMSFPDEVFVDNRINSRYNRYIGGGRWRKYKRQARDFLERINLWNTYQSLRRQ